MCHNKSLFYTLLKFSSARLKSCPVTFGSSSAYLLASLHALSYFFLPLAPAFFDALFFTALGLFFDLPLADLAALVSASPASSDFAFFGFAAGKSGAVKRSPSKAISVILTEVNGCRWP